MLSNGVANKDKYLDVDCSDLGERFGGELLHGDTAR